MASSARLALSRLLLLAAATGALAADARPRLGAADVRPPSLGGDARLPAGLGEFSAGALWAKQEQKEPSSSMSETVLQIINNVAGAGILTLSAGMSAGVGWVPATILCMVMGAISGYTFYIVGEGCELVDETSFQGLWSRALGPSSSWIVDASIALMCFSAAIIYSGILGDVSTQLLGLARLPPHLNIRGANIIAMTVGIILPLSLLKDLSALGFTSALGCVAILYTATFIALRALDGSYALPTATAQAGRLLKNISPGMEPSFKLASTWALDARALVLCSNLGLAYIAHYNAPAFYRTLERRSPKRFAKAVGYAFSALAVLYTAIMLLGYSTFGDHTSANLLKNYASDDTLALLGRLATGLSLLFGFPLMMVGLLDSATSVLKTVAANPRLPRPLTSAARIMSSSRRALTIAVLMAVSGIAIALTDIGTIVGVSGALLGAAIVYIFPSLIYSKLKHKGKISIEHALMTLGVVLGLLGVWQTLR